MPSSIVVFVEALSNRAHRLARRNLILSFVAGLVLGLSTSGGILWERLSFGSVNTTVLVGCLMAFASRMLLFQTEHAISLVFHDFGRAKRWSLSLFAWEEHESARAYRLREDALFAAQALGALLGASMVYFVTRAGPFAEMRWLSARPALLVNDGIAILCLIAFVWALAMNRDTALLMCVLILMTVFDATARRWCVDRPHHWFAVTVQQAIVTQFGLIAIWLAAARWRTVER